MRLSSKAMMASVSVGALMVVPGAMAQSADDGAATRTLGTITVTAQKREQNAQDVPVSISAFTGDSLNDLGITETDQLGQFLPGLEITTSSGEGSQLIVFLRGAGLSDFNTNNSGPIAIYSDEVYISSPVLSAFQFFDTERLEVLKGPQGTLYGRNTTGGAIKFIANKPTDEFELSLRGTYADFNSTELEGAISGPLSDRVRGRLAFSKVDSDGFSKNRIDGSDVNGVDTLAWRGFLDFDLTDDFTLRANLHGANNRSQSTSFNHLGILPGGTDALGYAGTGDPFEGEYNRIGQIDHDSIGGYIEANYEFGDVLFTSVTAYDDVDHVLPEETDASPLDLLFTTYGVESQTFSQELRVSGSTDKIEWLGGLFYLDESLDQNQTIDLFRELRGFTGGLSDPTGAITGAPILFARTLNEQSTESYAVFAQGSYDITDKLTGTIGLRYTLDERDFTAVGQLEDEAAFGPAPVVLYDFQDLSLSDEAISWRLALDYKATEDVLVYGSVSRGFKSGGFNGGFLSLDAAESARQVQPYEPEFLTAYEVGLKSDLFDNRLRLNGSVFLNDFEDLQIFTLVNTSALPIQVLDNAGGAQVVGLELDATAFPTDGLLLNLSVALLDSELQDVAITTGAGLEGNQLSNTPETSVTGLVRYEFGAFAGGTMHVQGSTAYKSEIFFSTENNPIAGQEAYTLLNAQVGYETADGRYSVNLFGRNITDEEYLTISTDLSDFGFFPRAFGQPQTFGIELSANF